MQTAEVVREVTGKVLGVEWSSGVSAQREPHRPRLAIECFDYTPIELEVFHYRQQTGPVKAIGTSNDSIVRIRCTKKNRAWRKEAADQ